MFNSNWRIGISAVIGLFLMCGLGPAGSRKGVDVNVGEPNIWSLEQAHYLLSRIRASNQSLEGKSPSADDLDPNRINSTRIQLLQEFLGGSVEYNQALGLQNGINLNQFRNNQARKQTLIQNMDSLNAQHLKLQQDIADLTGKKAEADAGSDTSAKTILAAQLGAKQAQDTEVKAALDSASREYGTINNSLVLNSQGGTPPKDAGAGGNPPAPDAGSGAGTPAAGTTPAAPPTITANTPSPATLSGLKDPLAKDLIANLAKNPPSPTLAASTALDNYIQMQYELVAKQLSLLKDEVGFGQRMVFLELPTSIYTSPVQGDRYIAQSWWKIGKIYTERDQSLDRKPGTSNASELKRIDQVSLAPATAHQKVEIDPNRRIGSEVQLLEQQHPVRFLKKDDNKVREVDEDEISPNSRFEILNRLSQGDLTEWANQDKNNTPLAHSIELIPRQSALNVNDIQDTVKGLALAFRFMSVFGLGGTVDYQRQREKFTQFVDREVFASGFGKGSDEFGWTFGPTPGSTHIAPGSRSTYAVLVVPRGAVAIELKGVGCYFPQQADPPASFSGNVASIKTHSPWYGLGLKKQMDGFACEHEKTFTIPIPSASTTTGFWVDQIWYQPVPAGARATVSLKGRYFSPQVSVLINGVPLRRSVSLGEPGLNPLPRDPNIPNPHGLIDGDYEVVNSKEIIFSFTAGSGFTGTPQISLVTPDRADTINNFHPCINGDCGKEVSLKNLVSKEPMFYTPLNIEPKVLSLTPKEARVHLAGFDFGKQPTVTVNGARAETHCEPPGLCTVSIDLTKSGNLDASEWTVVATSGPTTTRSVFKNPSLLNITGSKVIASAAGKTRTSLAIEVDGSGFSPHMSYTVTTPDTSSLRSPCGGSPALDGGTNKLFLQADVPKATPYIFVSLCDGDRPSRPPKSFLVTLAKPAAHESANRSAHPAKRRRRKV